MRGGGEAGWRGEERKEEGGSRGGGGGGCGTRPPSLIRGGEQGRGYCVQGSAGEGC